MLAEGLRRWLPRVIHLARPFLSSEDICKGQRWKGEIKGRLAKTNFAILRMTPDNLQAPWIHFEAGAVSKNPGVSHVTALLFDLKASDLVGPLTQFQHTLPTKEDRNSFSDYGSIYSSYSACNAYATDPPVIVESAGNFYRRLTVNSMNPQRVNSQNLQS